MFSKWREGNAALILLFFTGFPLLIFIISKAMFLIWRGVFRPELLASILGIFYLSVFFVIDLEILWSFILGGYFSYLRLEWIEELLLVLPIFELLFSVNCISLWIRGMGRRIGVDDGTLLEFLRVYLANLRMMVKLCWLRARRAWYKA